MSAGAKTTQPVRRGLAPPSKLTAPDLREHSVQPAESVHRAEPAKSVALPFSAVRAQRSRAAGALAHRNGARARNMGERIMLGRQAEERALLEGAEHAGLRAKLEVGGADDPEENAADRFATAMVGGSRAPCACGGTCDKCAGGKGGVIRRKSAEASAPPTTVSRAFSGPGRTLDGATRARFEASSGVDFSGVRIHTDSRAAATARNIGARAYALGSDIGFAQGAYDPASRRGQTLLAHELGHVALGHGGVRRAPDPHANSGGGTIAQATADFKPKEEVPLRPSSTVAYYRGVPVAKDAEFMRREMRRLIGTIGMEGADEWYGQFVRGEVPKPVGMPIMAHTYAFRAAVRSPLDAQRDMQDETIWNDARLTVIEVYTQVRAEALAYVDTFEANAITITLDILKASEASAEAERLRYGLQRWTTTKARTHRDGEGGTVTDYDETTHNAMENQLPGQSLAGAAKDLLAKREEISKLGMEQFYLTKTTCSQGGCFTEIPEANKAKHAELGKEREKKQGELAILQGTYQERYPVLGRISDDIRSLKALASGPSADAAEVLNDQVLGTLDNIAKVREELHPGGKASIWKLADIITLAKAASGANDATAMGRMRNRMVDDKVTQVKDNATWRERLMTVLIIGLSIVAALPSGGSSLAAGGIALAGISAFTLGAIQAVEHVDEYLLDKAMAGSDFDKAKAISASDPSLFWLGVEIVGAMVDAGAAVRGARTLLTAGRTAFTTLSSATRRFLAAEGADSAKALAELRVAADAAEGASGLKGLSGRVLHTAEELGQKGATVEKTLGHAAGNEAKAIAHGIEELDAAVGHALGKSPTSLGGHTVSVAPNGWLVRCTVCGTLRAEFAAELGGNKALTQRLLDLEGRSAKAAAAADKVAAQRIASEAAVLADELQALRSTERLAVLGPDAAASLIGKNPQLVEDLAMAQALGSEAGKVAMRDLLTRAELIKRAEGMSIKEIEKLLNTPAFAVGTSAGKDLRFVRYVREGGVLPFDRWEKMAAQAWENNALGGMTERELAAAYDLGKKNTKTMGAPKGSAEFIPDHVVGNPPALKWGESYDFVELKDWANMSQTGNVKAMLEYVEQTNSTLTLYFRNTTYMSNPLMLKIDALRKVGKVKLIPYVGK